ncbi:MAG: hypothetical protein WDM80_00945 [Limisphaerales bacterium]
MKSYWDLLADQFQHQQSPLRPCAEDVRLFHQIIRDWHREYSPSRTNALLFGVTPEITNLSWPGNTFLRAIEKSQAMIDVIWPGNIPNQRQVVCGNWLDVKIEEHSLDLVVGDGFLTGLACPQQYDQIAGTISRWLKPDGLLIARLFVRTEKKETMDAIMADLEANRIIRFDILKWRLAMAIQETAEQGVRVDDIYRAWCDIEKTMPALPEQAGWPRATVNTIKLYEGRDNRYAFPTIKELADAISPYLEQVSVTIPTYHFGQCCPILVYRRQGKPPSKQAVDPSGKS